MDNSAYQWDSVQAPQNLVMEQSFEYVTPLSLDECIRQIHDLRQPNSLFTTGSPISMNVSAHGFASAVSRTSKSGTVWGIIHGDKADDERTHLRIKVGISNTIFFTISLVVIGFIAFIMSQGADGWLLALAICSVLMFWMLYSLQSQRTQLIGDLKRVFKMDIL